MFIAPFVYAFYDELLMHTKQISVAIKFNVNSYRFHYFQRLILTLIHVDTWVSFSTMFYTFFVTTL